MSYLVTAGDEEYKEALSATELLGSPAEEFRKIHDPEIVTKGVSSIIKQNNSVIYLLIKALKKLEILETKVARLENSLIKSTKENPQFQEALEKLIQEVNRIKITEKGETVPPAVIRKSYFFKNLQEIFDSEKAKLSK